MTRRRVSAPLQPGQHVLDGLPNPRIMHVSRSLECGSTAAAAAVLTIQRVAHCYPSRLQGCYMLVTIIESVRNE